MTVLYSVAVFDATIANDSITLDVYGGASNVFGAITLHPGSDAEFSDILMALSQVMEGDALVDIDFGDGFDESRSVNQGSVRIRRARHTTKEGDGQ